MLIKKHTIRKRHCYICITDTTLDCFQENKYKMMKAKSAEFVVKVQGKVLSYHCHFKFSKKIKKKHFLVLYVYWVRNTRKRLLGKLNAVGTWTAGKCFHSFFTLSQTFTSVCIAWSKLECKRKKGKPLHYFKFSLLRPPLHQELMLVLCSYQVIDL